MSTEPEYNTIRDEMLQRFERIHDTLKHGFILYIAFSAYYLSNSDKFNAFGAFIILQLISILLASYIYRQFISIYKEGTHLKVHHEYNRLNWLKTSRKYHTWKIDQKIKRKWFYRIIYRWGGDSTSVAIYISVLVGFSLIDLTNLNGIGLVLCEFKSLGEILIYSILILINVIYIIKLSFCIQQKMKVISDDWEKMKNENESE